MSIYISLNYCKTLVQLYINSPRLWQEKHKPKTQYNTIHSTLYSSNSRMSWAMHACIPSGMTTLRCCKQGTKNTTFAVWNHNVIMTNEVIQSLTLLVDHVTSLLSLPFGTEGLSLHERHGKEYLCELTVEICSWNLQFHHNRCHFHAYKLDWE